MSDLYDNATTQRDYSFLIWNPTTNFYNTGDKQLKYRCSFMLTSVLTFNENDIYIRDLFLGDSYILDSTSNPIGISGRVFMYDLLTTYRILSLRTMCKDIDKNYPLNETIKILNNLVDKWSDPVDQLLDLYCYLYINKIIMNIPINSPLPKFHEEDDMDDKILSIYGEHIDDMINDIKNYLYIND